MSVEELLNYLSTLGPLTVKRLFASCFAASIGVLLLVKHKFLWIVIKTLRRDFTGIIRLLRVTIQLKLTEKQNLTVGKLFNRTVAKFSDKVCFYYNDEEWTFRQVQELTNRVGNYFSSLELKKGDVVCLFMENCPEYIPIWLGLSKPLKHSLEAVSCTAVIYGEELTEAIQDVISLGGLSKVPIFSYSRDGDVCIKTASNLAVDLLDSSVCEPIPSEPVEFFDNLYYIYTSGTTGFPKAAVIKHSRFCMVANCGHYMNPISAEDIIYNPLPLYHSSGGLLGAGQPLLFGTGMVIRTKFSASNFWSDCIRYEATVMQYIGECCRHLLAQPRKCQDKEHKVRLMLGNGLRKEMWNEFVTRFGIKIVAEFYGSTEGNCNMVNIDSQCGAVGFIPRILYPFVPMKIVKVNEATEEIIRDSKTGLALLPQPNEPGELVGMIISNHPIRDFEGYANTSAKRQRVAYNVLQNGDSCFRTGDILVMDELGYFYLKDRTGDTFKWKGKSVYTREVESVISKICERKDCVVYGVEIPGREGRVGMATIVDSDNSLDFKKLAEEVQKGLPSYARPIFLRVTNYIDSTGTYKLKKLDLQKQGFDINTTEDRLYFLNNDEYVSLDESIYKEITSGALRLE